jgi:hypothetical protein
MAVHSSSSFGQKARQKHKTSLLSPWIPLGGERTKQLCDDWRRLGDMPAAVPGSDFCQLALLRKNKMHLARGYCRTKDRVIIER